MTNDTLLLRPWQPDDVAALYAGVRESLDSLGRWFPWAHSAYSQDDTRAWVDFCTGQWAARREYPFGIFSRDTGEVLGGAGINQLSTLHRSGNLGYWVRTSRRGQGIAAGAARLAARFGFETAGLVRLEIVAAVDNVASRRSAERAGAQFECVARHRLVIHGVPHAAAVYSLIPEDLAAVGPGGAGP
jgi:ribosomal-protein-serine acetyltransferase